MDTGLGVEDWESKCQIQRRNERLKKEEQLCADWCASSTVNVTGAVGGNSYNSPEHISYLEDYGTLNKCHKTRLQDHSLKTHRDAGRYDSFLTDFSVPHSAQSLQQKRVERMLWQVAEMEEKQMMRPCKKNLRETKMRERNKLEDTLRSFEASQEGNVMVTECDSEDLDELQNSWGSEEDLEEIASLAEAICSENGKHYNLNQYTVLHRNCADKLQVYHEKKVNRKIRGWTPETILSPVEEPSDEYVDPMDELQCLVDTVSEYLAEKEEEISRYGSLPKSTKLRQSSEANTTSVSEDQSEASAKANDVIPTVMKPKKANMSNEDGLAGVKNAVSSLFNSVSEKVRSGSKPVSVEKAAADEAGVPIPTESGIAKIFSFIPKPITTTPVAVVSPAQEPAPSRTFSLQSPLPFQSLDTKETAHDGNQNTRPDSETSQEHHTDKGLQFTTNQSFSAVSSILEKINSLKLFSVDDISKSSEENKLHGLSDSKDNSVSSPDMEHQNSCEVLVNERRYQKRCSGSDLLHGKEVDEKAEVKKVTQECQSQVDGQPITQEENGLFSSLKKPFSSFIALSSSEVSQSQISPASSLFSTDDVTVPSQKLNEITCSGQLKFSCDNDVSSSKSVFQDQEQIESNIPEIIRKTHLMDSDAPKAHTAVPERRSKDNPETSWFSTLFKINSNENMNVQKGRQQSQSQDAHSVSNSTLQTQNILCDQQQCLPLMGDPNNVKADDKIMSKVNEQLPRAQPQGLISGLLNITSSNSQSRSGGLLSGLFKLGSSDKNEKQQIQMNSWPVESINQHNTNSQNQNSSQDGAMRSENVSGNNRTEPPQCKVPPSCNRSSQSRHQTQQTKISDLSDHNKLTSQQTMAHPSQPGVLSGPFRFASSKNVSSNDQTPIMQQQSGPLGSHILQQSNSNNLQSQNQACQPPNITLPNHQHENCSQTPGQIGNLSQQSVHQEGHLFRQLKLVALDDESNDPNPTQQQTEAVQQQQENGQNIAQSQSTMPHSSDELLSGVCHFASENVSMSQQSQPFSISQFTQQQKGGLTMFCDNQKSLKETLSRSGRFLSELLKFPSSNNGTVSQHSTIQGQEIHSVDQLIQLQANGQNMSAQQLNVQTEGTSPQASQSRGLVSSLFKIGSVENVSPQQEMPSKYLTSQPQAKSTDVITKNLNSPLLLAPSNKTNSLSGMFTKLTRSSEEVSANNSPADQVKYQENPDSLIRRRIQGSQTCVPQHLPETVEKTSLKQGFFAGLFNQTSHKNNSSDETEKLLSNTEDWFSNGSPSQCVNKRKDFDCIILEQNMVNVQNMSVFSNTECLDLRTSACSAASQNSLAFYSTNHPGCLTQHLYNENHNQCHHEEASRSSENLDTFRYGSPLSAVLFSPQHCLQEGHYSRYGSPLLCSPYNEYLSSENQELNPVAYYEQQWNQERMQEQMLSENDNSDTLASRAYCISQDNMEYFQASDKASMGKYSQSYINAEPNHYFTHTEVREDTRSDQDQGRCYQLENSISSQHDNDTRNSFGNIEDLYYLRWGKIGYCYSDFETALNLSTKNTNAMLVGLISNWDSFCDSAYNLSGVSYHQSDFERWQARSPELTGGSLHFSKCQEVSKSLFNGNFKDTTDCVIDLSSSAGYEAIDDIHLDESELYQQWLSVLEQGMWGLLEDGNHGYFVFKDETYVYALLTDVSGQYVYIFTPEHEYLECGQLSEPHSALLQNEMVIVCGFKLPLYNEAELLWLPGQNQGDALLINSPLDLSEVFNKGNQVMNPNLEQFSSLFEDCLFAQNEEPLDFTMYRINKVRMDTSPQYRQEHTLQNPHFEAFDPAVHDMSPYWNSEMEKELLFQKESVSCSSVPISESSSHDICNYSFLSRQRYCSNEIKVRHIDDVSEDEWRSKMPPVKERQSKPPKRIFSFVSDFKDLINSSSESELRKNAAPFKSTTMTSPSSAPTKLVRPCKDAAHFEKFEQVREVTSEDQQAKNVLSSDLQCFKAEISKDEPLFCQTPEHSSLKPTSKNVAVSPSSTTTRFFTLVTDGSVNDESTVSSVISKQPKLTRQRTQFPTANFQTTVKSCQADMLPSEQDTLHKSPDNSFYKHDASIKLSPKSNASQERSSAKSQVGFLSFLKSAVGMEEPKPNPPNSSETSEKSAESANFNTESTGFPNISRSISNMFNAGHPPSQQQPSETPQSELKKTAEQQQEGFIGKSGTNKNLECVQQEALQNLQHKGLNQQTLYKFGEDAVESIAAHEPNQIQEPGKTSEVLLPDSSVGSLLSQPKTIRQVKPEPHPKQSGGLFGLSVSNLLSGSAPNKDEPQGKRSSSMFGVFDSQQNQTEARSLLSGLFSGASSNSGSTSKGIFSLFAGSGPQPAPTSSTPDTSLSGSAAPKDLPGKSLFSMFSVPSAQQTSPQTGTIPEATSVATGDLTVFSEPVTRSVSTQDVLSPEPIPSQTTVCKEKSINENMLLDANTFSTQHSINQKEFITEEASLKDAFLDETPHLTSVSTSKESSVQPPPSQTGSRLTGILPGSTLPKDIPGKGLLSMFSGSMSQNIHNQNNSTAKDTQGKGLFSLFNRPSVQASAQSGLLLQNILPKASDTKEPMGKSLFSVFTGPDSSQTERLSKPPEPEGLLRLPSLFSLLGSPEGNKPKAGDSSVLNTSDINEKKQDASGKLQEELGIQNSLQSGIVSSPSDVYSFATAKIETEQGDVVVTLSQAPFQHDKLSPLKEPCSDVSSDKVEIDEETGLSTEADILASSENGCSAEINQHIVEETKPSEKQTPSESANVSGFVSKVFSAAMAPSIPASSFFSSPQSSFFKSSIPTKSQGQQKSSFFNLPSSLPMQSLKSDLLGIFRTAEPPKLLEATHLTTPDPSVQNVKNIIEVPVISSADEKEIFVASNTTDSSISSVDNQEKNCVKPAVNVSTEMKHELLSVKDSGKSIDNCDPLTLDQNISLTGTAPECCPSTEVPEMEKASCHESESVNDEPVVVMEDSLGKGMEVESVEKSQKLPLADRQRTNADPPPTKSMFDMPNLSAKFGFMPGSNNSGKSIGSFFSSPPSVPKGLPQMPQVEVGGLLSGFRAFSAGLFQEEKPEGFSVSLKGFGFSGQKETPDPSKPQSASVITTQPKAHDDKLAAADTLSKTDSNDLIMEVRQPGSDRSTNINLCDETQEVVKTLDNIEIPKQGPTDGAEIPQELISSPMLKELLSDNINEVETLFEPRPSTELKSGVFQDTHLKMDHLSIIRLVPA